MNIDSMASYTADTLGIFSDDKSLELLNMVTLTLSGDF